MATKKGNQQLQLQICNKNMYSDTSVPLSSSIIILFTTKYYFVYTADNDM